jgi:exodeoxyribonuclease VII large subunit
VTTFFDLPDEEEGGSGSPEGSGAGGGTPGSGAAEADAGDPGGSGPRVWTVSQVNRAVRELLEGALPPVWVGGEVGSWTRARSGHCYFTLKDEKAQIRCVMWRSDADRLPTDPDQGMRVRAFGSLTLYEARGEFQLGVKRLEGEGEEGLWRLAFEKLRGKLEAEGLLDSARKRSLPRFPRTIGVVTSPTGAAFRDIVTVVRRRAPWTRILLRGTRVQGEGAAREIADAIRVLGGSGRVELLIVGRGGGSIEDLWAFNEEPVARAVAECPVPVISAVGHETDVTISDLVADLRAPTPSAGAEAAVQDRESLLQVLTRIRPRLARGLRRQVDGRRQRLREGSRRLQGGMVRGVLPPLIRRTERGGEALERGIRLLIQGRRERLSALAGRVEALSPLSTLRRGYAVPLAPEGGVLRRAEDFRRHPRFHLRVVDGRIECRTEEVLDQAELEEAR